MTREELSTALLQSDSNNYLLELSTGVGKTKLALDKINSLSPESVLVVVPRNVLKENWRNEIIKWGYKHLLPNITFTTYASLHKYVSSYTVVCYDEAHHITDRVLEFIPAIHTEYNLLLSATINRNMLYTFKIMFDNLNYLSIDISTAIDNDILPEPTIIKKPLNLQNIKGTYVYSKGKKNASPKKVQYKEYRRFLKSGLRLEITCTAYEYYTLLSGDINYYSKLFKSSGSEIAKNKYLRLSKSRLEFLAKLKTNIIKSYLNDNMRALVFCADINQCDEVSLHTAIHSKKKDVASLIESFDKKEINIITACNMLNEGISLKECEYGVFAYINASEIMSKQKIGRILRHAHPKLVLFYFADTREEELVQRLLDNLQ